MALVVARGSRRGTGRALYVALLLLTAAMGEKRVHPALHDLGVCMVVIPCKGNLFQGLVSRGYSRASGLKDQVAHRQARAASGSSSVADGWH